MDYGEIIVRADGSYVITNHGMPYHVPNSGDYVELWKSVDEYAKSNPDKVAFEHEYVASMDDLKAAKLAEVNYAYDEATSSLVATYPQTELLTFDKQEQEARAWLADNSVSTPLIDALAQGRGIDKAGLIHRIIVKADAFALATGYLTGQRQRYEDLLDAATTVEEVEAIVPEYHFPET